MSRVHALLLILFIFVDMIDNTDKDEDNAVCVSYLMTYTTLDQRRRCIFRMGGGSKS